MGFALDRNSQGKLALVHPDLIRVVNDCAANGVMPFQFVVIEGMRTLAQEQINVDTGASETLHSRHLANKQGLACAVDLGIIINNKLTWSPKPYMTLAVQMKASAHKLVVPMEWGGDWETLKDLVHYQLPWAQYP